MFKKVIALSLFASLVATSSYAGVRKEFSISSKTALKAAEVALEKCQDLGFKTVVTVVDHRAQLKTMLVDDDVFPHAVETSKRKAMTAASRRTRTSIIEEENKHESTLGDVFNEIGLITLSGGVPIIYEGKVIGAIGVAGAPGEDLEGEEYDDICSDAGVAAIQSELK